jgi:hypothetical protein
MDTVLEMPARSSRLFALGAKLATVHRTRGLHMIAFVSFNPGSDVMGPLRAARGLLEYSLGAVMSTV